MTTQAITKNNAGDSESANRVGTTWNAEVLDNTDLSIVLNIGSLDDAKFSMIPLEVNPTSGTYIAVLDKFIQMVDVASSAMVSKAKITYAVNSNDDTPTLAQSDKYLAIADFLITTTDGKKRRT